MNYSVYLGGGVESEHVAVSFSDHCWVGGEGGARVHVDVSCSDHRVGLVNFDLFFLTERKTVKAKVKCKPKLYFKVFLK